MFNWVSRVAILLGSLCPLAAIPSYAQKHSTLTSLSAIHSISNDVAAQSLPVSFEGTVTYYEIGNIDLFVQDGDTAIYVEVTPDLQVVAGDRVLVQGITRASFKPEILSQRVTVLHHGNPPEPVRANFRQLIRAELDCQRATVRAKVRAANVFKDGARQGILLDLLMPGGPLQAQIANADLKSIDLHSLLDNTVELTGAVAGKFDSKNQMTGVLLEVASIADLSVVDPASTSPRRIPLRSFDEILQTLNVDDQTERVRVQGTITYDQPGAAMVLQDGSKALWVDTLSEEPHQVGEVAVVSGFPDVRNGSVVLTRAEIQSAKSHPALKPLQVDGIDLASGSHAFELVSIEGQLVMRVRESAQDQYVIASNGHVFSAIYRHPERGVDLPMSPMRDISLGSRVRVTGICVLDRGDQFRGQVAFHLLLRSGQDLTVVAGPSLVSVQNLLILLAVVVIFVFIVIGKAFFLERKLRRQDGTAASTIERWRNRVIEGINNAIPLAETLLQITELLSFKLQVEYCWAEVDGAGTFGNCPSAPERATLQVIERPIPGRSGTVLGRICAGFPAASKPRVGPDSFENALRLSALAIETGGKFSDLVRRSELDPLTNARNRFAFDRTLDLAIEREKITGCKFGLIYIDLDGFKQVNDEFGHQIGDRFLQETVLRLGHQLRSDDVLARIGGDEFAVVINNLGSRQELNEIASRLNDCFDSPLCFDRIEIPAAASIGCAIFPDDASTKDEILACADTRMYREKRQKRHEVIDISAISA